jgi:hypothetical protein
MFRPTLPFSGVYDILLFIPEGICFAVFVTTCNMQHATKATKTAKQIPSGIKSKISYTPEDGHVGRKM